VRQPPLLFAAPENDALASRLAEAVGGELGTAVIHRFPDEETYIRLETPTAGRDVAIVCTLDRPDQKYLPLTFLADTARDLGATRVGLIAPYLSYLRQDQRFRPHDGVTSRYFARLVSETFEWLVTVDPHLHRYPSLASVYDIPARAVHVAPELGRWISAHVAEPLIVGPDVESAQWAGTVAAVADAPLVLLEKVRRGDADVSVSVPDVERHRGRTPVLVDDIISTAQTMIETLRRLREAGCATPACVAVHAIMADGAHDALRRAGADRVVTCNTIVHASNAIDIVPALAEVVAEVLAGR
jgi:ribose-phosphate pyrophosphokinase